MSKNDQEELNALVGNDGAESCTTLKHNPVFFAGTCAPPRRSRNNDDDITNKQWTMTNDGKRFQACGQTIKELPSGFYKITVDDYGRVVFNKIPICTEELIVFPGTNSETILTEIQDFWKKKKKFKQHGLAYKRGILLWGEPGGGKTSIIELAIHDLIQNRGGVCFQFDNPELFKTGFQEFRNVQPETPVIAILEDIDSIIRMYEESALLNILDGVENVENIIFIATTNYPERLGARIVNRPSRFDKRFKVELPTSEARRIYINKLINRNGTNIDADKWIADTNNFTFAHIKELFISVVVLGNNYDENVETLRAMIEKRVKSSDAYGTSIGFNV
jgi:GTPase SAR1 family protein